MAFFNVYAIGFFQLFSRTVIANRCLKPWSTPPNMLIPVLLVRLVFYVSYFKAIVNLIFDIFSMLMLLGFFNFSREQLQMPNRDLKLWSTPTKYDDSGSFGVVGFIYISHFKAGISFIWFLTFFRCLCYFWRKSTRNSMDFSFDTESGHLWELFGTLKYVEKC